VASRLLIVASCTQLKRKSVPQSLCLRQFASGSARLSKWRRALESVPSESAEALELYGGGFWSVIRELSTVAERRGFLPTLFVASAGYGLVSAAAQLKPYSATFAHGIDSVLSANESRDLRKGRLTGWWNGLSSWRGPNGHKGPRSMEKLAKRFPDSSILVIGSPDYVTAMSDDLRKAAAVLRHPERLVIVSSVSGFPRQLDDHLVPSVAALQHKLGGSLGSLHARTARQLVANARPPLHAKRLAAKYRRQASVVPRPASKPKRKPRSDEQVRSFIRRRLMASVTQSCSRLLRAYRDGGSKCEQHRFRRLFDEVTHHRKAS
jgi:hypothetical protein